MSGRIACSLIALLVFPLLLRAEESPPRIELTAGSPALSQAQVNLEVDGALRPAGGEQANKTADPSGVKVAVRGEFTYVEKRLPSDPQQHAARHYLRAGADIEAGNTRLRVELPADRRLVVWHRQTAKTHLFAPAGPLNSRQRDLLEIPASSMAVDGLLPGRQVALHESWPVSEECLAALLNLEAVSEQSVKVSLVELTDGQARLKVEGNVSGMADGALTKIGLAGKVNYLRSAQLIEWVALLIQEERAAGPVRPGFKVTARLRMRREALADCPPELNDEALQAHKLTPTGDCQSVAFTAIHGEFELIHPETWHVAQDRADLAILRLLHDGEAIAQCNISILPDLPLGQSINIEGFQRDVQTALGNHLHRIVDARKQTTDDGRYILRVLAAGEVEKVPVQWIYYHLADEEGRRAAMIFTLRQEVAEKFGAADVALAENLTFRDGDGATDPPAASVSAVPADSAVRTD